MIRLKLFYHLLFRKFHPDMLQNACYLRPIRAWKYSKLVDGKPVLGLVYCSLCEGTGRAYGVNCFRCDGSGTIGVLNPSILNKK